MKKPKPMDYYNLMDICDWIKNEYELSYDYWSEFCANNEASNGSVFTITTEDIMDTYTQYTRFTALILAHFGPKINVIVDW